MKSKSLEDAYQRLWAATENGTVSDEFFELREEARYWLVKASNNQLMQKAGTLLLEVHQEWDEVGEQLGLTGAELNESWELVMQRN